MPSQVTNVPLVRVYDYLKQQSGPAAGNASQIAGRTVTLTLTPQTSGTSQVIATSINPITQLPFVPVQSSVTDGNGYWEAWVVPTDNITPAGMQYIVDDGYRTYKINPTLAGIPGIGWQSSAIITSAAPVLNPAGQTVSNLTVTAGLSLSFLTAQEVLFIGGGGAVSGDSVFVWDTVNKKFGINTAAPLPGSTGTRVGAHIAGNTDTVFPSLLFESTSITNPKIFGLVLGQDQARSFQIRDINSGISRLLIDTAGNIGIGVTVPLNLLHLGGTSAPQTNALMSARVPGNDIEFGHTNPAGYGSTIGSDVGDGRPFVAFNAEAGSTNNTFRTRGIFGSIFTSDLAGGFIFETVANANADNQAPATLMTLSHAGLLQLLAGQGIDTTSAGQLVLAGIATSAKFKTAGSLIVGTSLTTLGAGAQTLTAAALFGGIIEHTVTAAVADTFDTGANLDAAFASVLTGDTITCILTIIGAFTVTLTAAAGITLRGTAAVVGTAAGKVVVLTLRRTGAAAWTVYAATGA